MDKKPAGKKAGSAGKKKVSKLTPREIENIKGGMRAGGGSGAGATSTTDYSDRTMSGGEMDYN
jgi:hypothetical protein